MTLRQSSMPMSWHWLELREEPCGLEAQAATWRGEDFSQALKDGTSLGEAERIRQAPSWTDLPVLSDAFLWCPNTRVP